MDIVTSYDNWGGKGDRRSILSGHSQVFDGTETTYMYYGNNGKVNIDIIFSGLEGKLYIDCIKVILTNYGIVDNQLLLNGKAIGTYVVNQDYKIPMLTIRKNDKLTFKGRNNQTGSGTYPTYIREIQFKTFLVPDKSFIYHEGEYKRWNEGTLTVPSHWETISHTLPKPSQFLEKGMYLSPLLDRRVEKQKPIAMIQRNDILDVGEVGKTFSGTIDLKKYFDIRSIKVEVK